VLDVSDRQRGHHRLLTLKRQSPAMKPTAKDPAATPSIHAPSCVMVCGWTQRQPVVTRSKVLGCLQDAPSQEDTYRMSELGRTLREAREAAGLSLAGMAKRTGYSRGYLGNIETGERQATPDVIKAYERALGDSLNRRQLLLGSLSSLAASSADDAAVRIAHEVTNGRSGLLAELQTSHETDKAIASLVAPDTASLAALTKWSRRGRTILRVNAAGILAKTGSPLVDTEALAVLRTDGDVRELYLTAVLARVLSLPWSQAGDMATSGLGLSDADVGRLAEELRNPYDAGARWCSAVMLYRSRNGHPATVNSALLEALRTEPSRENLRAIGSALAGVDPLTI